jgi:hypothetical protein
MVFEEPQQKATKRPLVSPSTTKSKVPVGLAKKK